MEQKSYFKDEISFHGRASASDKWLFVNNARLGWRLSRAGDYYIIAFQVRNYAAGELRPFSANMAFIF